MHNKHFRPLLPYIAPAGIVFFLLGSVVTYQFTKINSLEKQIRLLSVDVASTTAMVTINTNQLAEKLSDLRTQTAGLSNTLSSAQENINAVKTQVGGVEQTVGTLNKLAQVDAELLKKYSKVYFMNENYTPVHLTTIPEQYVYNQARKEQFLTEAWPYLENLLTGAQANGVALYVKSGYRSFAEQKSLKSAYSVTYGAGTANAFSADQGYSEHQLGTTLDFITTGTNGQLTGFDKTRSYLWLVDNAHRFGFVLSYPQGNKFYIYEPWHWRFVGIKLATYLHDNHLNFYDVDQRIIDKYLANIFD
jgi:D-alanyl-D-alanine carboxypeptidase